MTATAPGNIDQVEYWNGDVGRQWTASQERLDRAFRPFTAALIERAAPRRGERVVDVGCGCGELSLALAGLLGDEGRILAVDVSRPMLDRARSRTEAAGGKQAGQAAPAGQAEIEWQQADAAVAPFAASGFDLLVSRFGVMFFGEPVGAFRNLRRALRPGGRLAMLCWRPMPENAWVAVPRAAMLPAVPAPAAMPPDAPGPFAFADAARVGAILAQAGFAEIASVAVDAPLEISGGGADQAALETAVQFVAEVGPASGLLRDIDAATRERAVDAVREALRERAGGGRLSLDAACWIYTATSPAALPASTF